MNRRYLGLALVATFAFLQGCAFTPQKANISPRISVQASNEGKNVQVGVRILDERPSKSLGRRGTAYGAAAEITSEQELAVVVQQQVIEALRKKGFSPVDFNSPNNAKLTVEIRLLEYSTSQGFWTGGVHVKGALKAVAQKSGDNYEKLYRIEKEERVMVVPTAESNEALINTALSDLLGQMLDDSALIKLLTT